MKFEKHTDSRPARVVGILVLSRQAPAVPSTKIHRAALPGIFRQRPRLQAGNGWIKDTIVRTIDLVKPLGNPPALVLLQVVTERCRVQLTARHALPLRKLLGRLKKLVRNRNRRLHSRSDKSDRGTVSRTDRG